MALARTLATEKPFGVLWRLVSSPYTSMAALSILLIVAVMGGLAPTLLRESTVWKGPAPGRAFTVQGSGFQARSFSGSGHEPRWLQVLLAIVAMISVLRLLQAWIPSWGSMPPMGTAWQILELGGRPSGEAVSRAAHLTDQRVVGRATNRGTRYLFMSSIGLARWLPACAYLGLVLLIAAGPVGTHFAWEGEPAPLSLGETLSLGDPRRTSVRLEELAVVPRPDGTMERFDSRVVLWDEGESPAAMWLRLNRRTQHGGLAIYSLGYGPALRVTARDNSGKELLLRSISTGEEKQGALRVRFSDGRQDQAIVLPDASLLVRLIRFASRPEQGAGHPSTQVQVVRALDGQLLFDSTLPENGRLVVSGITLSVAPEYYAIISAQREPDLPVAAAGAVLIVLGLISGLLLPRREVWIAIPDETSEAPCQLYIRGHDWQRPWVTRLASLLSDNRSDG